MPYKNPLTSCSAGRNVPCTLSQRYHPPDAAKARLFPTSLRADCSFVVLLLKLGSHGGWLCRAGALGYFRISQDLSSHPSCCRAVLAARARQAMLHLLCCQHFVGQRPSETVLILSCLPGGLLMTSRGLVLASSAGQASKCHRTPLGAPWLHLPFQKAAAWALCLPFGYAGFLKARSSLPVTQIPLVRLPCRALQRLALPPRRRDGCATGTAWFGARQRCCDWLHRAG